MVIDLIKEYLVGIGFNVDSNSFENAKTSIEDAGSKIKEFNDSNNKGFSDTGNSLKNLFSILGSSNTLSKLFPEMNAPFKELISKITLLKNLFREINETKLNKKEIEVQEKKTNSKTNTYTTSSGAKKEVKVQENKDNARGLISETQNLADGLGNVKNVAKSLLTEGGGALKTFSTSALGPIAIVTTAIAGTITVVKKLASSFNELANQDIKWEKLSRQLWTTKETAKEINSALKGVGATMDDLWLSPTLLKQFNQLRKDSAGLRLPPEFKDNIKVVQGLGLEFKRFKQLVSLLFQWIGNYILKYLAGPLNEIKGTAESFNEWLMQNIPKIAEVIGTIIGFLLRIIILIGELIGFVWKLTTPIRYVFGLLKKLGNIIKNAPKGVKTAVKAIIGMIVLIFAPIIGLIALVDDFFTFLRGGKSVIGDVFNGFKKIGGKVIDGIKEKFGSLKDSFKNGMGAIKDGWNGYWERASESLDKIKEKAKKIWGDIKEWSKGVWEKGKDMVSKVGKKVVEFVGGEDNEKSVATSPKSYVTNNSKKSSVSTSNSNNKVSNKNTINVYSTDANSTASAVDKRLKGINMRNQQGVIG